MHVHVHVHVHVHGMCMACMACAACSMCMACAWHVQHVQHASMCMALLSQANTSGVGMGKWDAGCVDFLQKQVKHIVVAKPTTP